MQEDSDADLKVDAQEPENAAEPTGEQLAAGRWASVRAVWLNAVALAVVLVVTLLLLNNGSIAIYDEAVYAAQAQALVDGSWVSERSAADLDPEGIANPLLDSTIVGDGAIAYSRHPLYPVLLVPLMAIGGYSAALFMSVFGVVAAAVCAAFLARRVDARYGVPALWLAGVASPLVIDAVVLWAHGLAAATAGLTLLSALRAIDGRRMALNLVVTAIAVCLTVMLRSEGVLFVLVVGLVVCARAVRWRRPRAIDWRVLPLGVGLAIVGLGTYFVDVWWSRRIGGLGSYGTKIETGVFGEVGGPLDALWKSLLRPGRVLVDDVTPILTGSSVFLVIGALAVRFRVRWRAFPWGLSMMGAAGWVWTFVEMPDSGAFFSTGLFPAFPALLFAALLIGRPELRRVELGTAAMVAGIGVAVLLTFVHSDAGTEWGGRFFHVLLVPTIPLVLAVLDRSRGYFNAAERKLFVVPVVVLLLVPSASALKFVGTRKVVIERQIAGVLRLAPSIRSEGHLPLVIVWRFKLDGTARQFWEQREDLDLLAPIGGRALLALLNRPDVVERGAALLVTDAPLEILELAFDAERGGSIWRIDRSEVGTDGLLHLVQIRAANS